MVRHDDCTDQNNTTNYQFKAKMAKYLQKLKAERMYFVKKGRTAVVLFTYVFCQNGLLNFNKHHTKQ